MKTTSRRKMYQKRRKKERAEKRKNSQRIDNQKKQPANRNCQCNQKKNNPTTRNNHQHLQNNNMNRLNGYTEGMKLWWRTYCTLKYHSEQRRHWEHGIIRQDLNAANEAALLDLYAKEYETSSEEEEGEEALDGYYEELDSECDELEAVSSNLNEVDIDMEYLKFLEITHKHQEELRLKREAENS
ncbi:uncharacterized protein [Musca autumnalis]|uniref:uncharacterized protein n=1 Tax=Musca autumnalis TaxID=221902 RepID=UPI003CEC078D